MIFDFSPIETAMDKDGMLSHKMCSNDKDCGLGKKCIPTPLFGTTCVEAPNNAKTPQEGA